jgi:serine/threonine protein kinase
MIMTTEIGDATASDDRIGGTLADRYQIEAVIGRGGMSTVYRAADTFLGRTVALKVFRPDLADADDLRRQHEEIQLIASLNHSTLVTLFDAVAEESGRISLVLEYVEGHDLRTELSAGRVDEQLTALIGADIADALAYIHERGIVHRDMKPGNLLVPVRSSGNSGPHAKLADFGIARLVDGTRLTSTGSLLGTAGYLSPEQALGGAIGPASDVYSFGLVLLECLTGTRAFEGTALESVTARLSRDPEIPTTLGPAWCDVLERMTRREPRDRATARELSTELRTLALSLSEAHSLDVTMPYRAMAAPAAAQTQATEVLRVDSAAAGPLPSHRSSAAPAEATAAFAAAGATTAPGRWAPEAEAPRERTTSARKRTATPWVVVAIVALLLVGAAAWVFSSLNPGTSDELPAVNYPVVEGDLGSHLEQLQRSVEK